MSVIKSVVLKGEIKNFINYQLCPSTEFSEGVWNLCINSIAYSCTTENVNELCSISANMVKSQKINDEFMVQTYEQPLALFLLNTKPSKNIRYFGKSFK